MNPETETRHDADPGAGSPYPFRGVFRFVAVFVVLVLLQLIGYRYIVISPANDWYLFQVARHTTGLLDRVGHGATLESDGTSKDPRSAWAQWQDRAERARASSSPPPEMGPRVHFVWRPGIHQRIQELELARAADSVPSANRDAQIQALREQVTASLGNPEQRAAQQGKQFRFDVVPTCGATEIMAIFLAAILAFPATWRQRMAGLLLGIPTLYGINLLRLTCLAIIGAMDGGGAWFNFAHEYVWQAVYVGIVVLLWLAWVEYIVRRHAP